MRFDILLSSDALSEAQRWQLVSSLYDQVRSLIEGSVALLVTLGICALYTGWPGFWALAGATLLVLVLRLLHWRRFMRARRAQGPPARPPEAWACDYTLGICTMASLWAAVVVSTTFVVRDMQLLTVVLLIQNAWLAGAGVRNAASPSAVLGQTLITVVPATICTFFGTTPLVRILAPSCFVFILILLRIARFYGTQMLSLMESEQRLAAANEELRQLSCTDGLTGIANRRAFDDKLAKEWAYAARHANDIAVVMIDVDFFKRYNDHYGHPEGDACLRAIAGHLGAARLRASDMAARYGGEEFALLLPGNADHEAHVVAARLCRAVYDANLPHSASPLGRVTISVGVASMVPGLTDLPAGLLALADQALYQAKQSGRNRVCVAAPALAIARQEVVIDSS